MVRNWILAVIIVLVVVFFSTVYIIQQTQEGIVLRLGKIETTEDGKALVVGPGLHFKLPFVETVRDFDMRLRTLDIDSSRIMTEEQKDVLVDAYVKWRINNIVEYFKATGGDQFRTETLLKQKVNDGMRATFGQHTIAELLSNKRNAVMQTILVDVKKAAESMGVDIIDVRIKRIDLPTEVAEKIYARMRSAREKMASLIRADGEQQAEVKRAGADAKVAVTISTANSNAAKVRALGEADAAHIYAEEYKQNPGFYSFYRSLEAYQAVFTKKQANLVLQPEGRFFEYFRNDAQQK